MRTIAIVCLLPLLLVGCIAKQSDTPGTKPSSAAKTPGLETDANPESRLGKTSLDLSSVSDATDAGCLQLIHQCSTPGWCQNPVPNIRAVNALVPLGKERSLRILRKYAELSDAQFGRFGGFPSPVHTVGRLAFLAREDGQSLRAPGIGSFMLMIREGSPHWGHYPFVIVKGIPFDLSDGLTLSGVAEPVESYLDYLEKEAELRSDPLVPADNPLEAVDELITSGAWKDIRFEGEEPGHKWYTSDSWKKMSVREQALGAVSALFRPDPDIRYLESYTGTYPWDDHLASVRKLNIRWDAKGQKYVVGR